VSSMQRGHVASDHLGEAAQHASLDGLSVAERSHVESCEQCRRLYAGYRLTDRLLSSTWRQTSLPASVLEKRPIRVGLAGFLDVATASAGRRWLVPAALTACLAALVGFGVLLPQLLPAPGPAAGSHSASPVASQLATSSGPATSGRPGKTPAGTQGPGQSPGTGPGGSPAGPGTTRGPSVTPTPSGVQLVALAGWPVAWAPDGRHLLVTRNSGWTNSHQIQVLDSGGGLVSSFTAQSATWVDSRTIAAATSGGGKGPHGSDTVVALLDLGGRVIATIPGGVADGAGSSGALLLGSGNGDLAIAGEGAWGPSASTYKLWDGHKLSASHAGVPIAFSRDGKKLAVLHPSGSGSSSALGWLEIVSVPGLSTTRSLTHTTVRVAFGGGPGYAPDVAFSPNGGSLLIGGTLVDLSRGSAAQVGEGGWLPDGTLVTASGGQVLRWQGGHSTVDTRFGAGGSVETSRHGDVIEYFGDGRPALLLTADGTLRQIDLPGVSSIDALSLAPDGGAMALDGRAGNGSRVIAVAQL
jgi:hypothetical protein